MIWCLTLICGESRGETVQEAKIDSVLQLLDTDLKPRKRIALQLRLVTLYKMAHPDVDSLIEASLAQAKDGDFEFYIARALKFRARYRLYLNDSPDLILTDIDSIQAIASRRSNKLIPGWVSRLMAQYYLQIGQPDSAEVYLDSLQVQIKRNPFNRDGIYHTVKGMYYQEKRLYELAMAEYQKALNHPNAGRSYVLNHISRLCYEIEDYDQASIYALESINTGPVNNTIPKIASYILLGDVAMAQSDTLAAQAYYIKAEGLRAVPYYSNNYSALAKLINIYEAKEPQKVAVLLRDISDYKYTDDYPRLLMQKGKLAYNDGDEGAAQRYLTEALKIGDRDKDYQVAIDASDLLSIIARKAGKLEEVVQYIDQRATYQSAYYDQVKIKSLARSLAQYESEKDKALLQQAHAKDQLILQERLKRFTIVGLLASLILLVAGVSWYKLRKRNQVIKSQNEVISKALSEKDLLLREIHHRVKNNLQLVSGLLTLQGRSISDEMAQQAIQEGKNRVRSMALIHQDLYNKENLTGIGVNEYISKLTRELFATYNENVGRIKLHINVDDLELDVDTLVPLGLIINELITNSLKYAFKERTTGNLWIDLIRKDQHLQLTVKDDGIGFNQDKIRPNSFGTSLISSLTDQLEGTLSVLSVEGTCTTIIFDADDK